MMMATMGKVKKLIDNYWMVLLVGALFALTSIYNEFGLGRDVLWNTFIKTTRELFLIVLLWKHKSQLNNVISMLFCYGAISLSMAYITFRLFCAVRSGWNYPEYWDLMKNVDLRLTFSIIIFVILLFIKYLNKK